MHGIAIAGIAFALITLPGIARASPPVASADDQRALWTFAEALAVALPQDNADFSNTLRAASDPSRGRIRIGKALSGVNGTVTAMGHDRTTYFTLNLTGACVPLSALHARYPTLQAAGVPLMDQPAGSYSLATVIGQSRVTYSFGPGRTACLSGIQMGRASR
ncbi:hypothetical protein EDF77_2699 [Stenotrophomonas maltophilia]|uniref:hypothetical protein n=1 Tax=Stenotrophomonas chelatiphaga TaxID=517011 RepID=UPI000F4C7F21|nr:hypothetical protein [Stenotrophomonas chelatiphaga]MCS4230434.1 hypothetical protein [Stenotrophomonas chelatiphaga]ROQ40360.1 hypothetical protein EDF77_2699 [Stenotrophomonas maltophilia]